MWQRQRLSSFDAPYGSRKRRLLQRTYNVDLLLGFVLGVVLTIVLSMVLGWGIAYMAQL
jgi:hypothetical protein